MKVLTSNQSRILEVLIDYAGGNEVLEQALRSSAQSNSEVSVDDLVKEINRIRLEKGRPASGQSSEHLGGRQSAYSP
jgi:hypothetical protein